MARLSRRTVSGFATVIRIRKRALRNWLVLLTSVLVNLRGDCLSKVSESSYWDGFLYGISPLPNPYDSPEGYRLIEDVEWPYSYQRAEDTGYPLYAQGSFAELSREDQAFWAGFVSGGLVLSGSLYGFGAMVGAEIGLFGSVTVAASEWLAGTTFAAVAAPVLVVTAGALAAGAITAETNRLQHISSSAFDTSEGRSVLMGQGSWGSVV